MQWASFPIDLVKDQLDHMLSAIVVLVLIACIQSNSATYELQKASASLKHLSMSLPPLFDLF